MPQLQENHAFADEHSGKDNALMPRDFVDHWDRTWPQSRGEFESLVDTYLDRLVRYAYNRLGNQQDAEDVVQEVFLRSFSDRAKRKQIVAVGPYLYRSVGNACIDVLRKRNTSAVYREEVGVTQMLCHNTSPSASAETADELRRAERLLGQLPDSQAEAIRLRTLDGLRLNEIAEVVGCSINTVCSRLRYGFHKLQELIAEEGVGR